MNLHIKLIIFVFIINTALACKTQTDKHNQITEEKGVVTASKTASSNQEETIEQFLERAKRVSQSEDENDLKSIIKFPLVGQGENNDYTETFANLEALKANGRVYSFFRENLGISTKIEKDEDLGNDWFSIKYNYPKGKNDYFNYFKLNKTNGKYIIVGVYIPGA